MAAARAGPDMGTRRGPVRACPAKGSRGRSSTPVSSISSNASDQVTCSGRAVRWVGTGSGCSLYEPKPSFQTDTGCANRSETDVSADADPETGVAVYQIRGNTLSGVYAFVGKGTTFADAQRVAFHAAEQSMHNLGGGTLSA